MTERNKQLQFGLEFSYTNRFVFNQVMQDYETMKMLLERIFPDRKIADLCPSKGSFITEANLEPSLDSHGVRLDVLFEGDNSWYDVEMQVRYHSDLPKRSRYYHSLMDEAQLKRRQKYRELKPHYVIFICLFDPFGLGEPVYEFQTFCSKNQLPLGDESYTIFLNTECSELSIPGSLRSYFMYVSGRDCDEKDTLVKSIHERVTEYNSNPLWRDRIMTVEDLIEELKEDALEDGKAEGIELGRAEGRAEGIAEGIFQVAQNMKNANKPISEIVAMTGLSREDVESLS